MSLLIMPRKIVHAFLLLALCLWPQIATAETLSGSNVDSRVIVGLKVDAAGLAALMPEGWAPVAFPGGPIKGANMLFALIDGVLEMDAEGKPLDPASRRAVVFVGMGRKGETVRQFVLKILTTVPQRNPYGVASAAEIERSRTVSGPANGARAVSDAWRIAPAEGGEKSGEVTFKLDYTTGRRAWMPGELFPYSAAEPDFSRIYRFNQLVDLVVSAPLGKPSSGTFQLSNSVEGLQSILNGSEETVAVIDIPVYVRQVYLP
ncbi:MAG: hypothetical protein MJH08_14700 [Hyphomicrobiales bacterium]|nr:hypothetical protein [Hyphomicrobiales bacterium]